jgi:hypothetical protein
MFRHHQYPNYPNRTESSFPFNSTQSPPQEDSDEEIGNVSTSNSSITVNFFDREILPLF